HALAVRLPVVSFSAARRRQMMKKPTKQNRRKAKRPKAKLGLPDLEHAKTAVLNSLRSPESKRGCRQAIDDFVEWYCSEPRLSLNKTVVTRFRIQLEERHLARHDQWKIGCGSTSGL